MFLLNVLLALAWVALTEQFTPVNFAIGFGLGYLMLWLAQRTTGALNYFVKVPQVIRLALFFLWELILANLRAAFSVLAPRNRLRPGVIAVPIDVRSDAEATLLANLLTLTPGTLSLDVSADRKILYLHAMHVDDADRFRREIKEGFERRLREVLE
jgi:multicomponent Na+:H+ antiporter subunit E